jgi:hypothetical protein
MFFGVSIFLTVTLISLVRHRCARSPVTINGSHKHAKVLPCCYLHLTEPVNPTPLSDPGNPENRIEGDDDILVYIVSIFYNITQNQLFANIFTIKQSNFQVFNKPESC